MSKTRRGFTLVELLAVIVILAIILVIAVPQIMNVITEARKGALISSAKLIASTAERAKLSNDTLGIEKSITCEDVSKLNSEDYESCTITFDSNGKAQVTIVGKGKFEGMSVCDGTKENAEVSSECTISTDAACFTHEETQQVSSFDINEEACKTVFAGKGLTADEAETFCAGGVVDGITMKEYIILGNLPASELETAGVISNVQYVDGISITDYDDTCTKDVLIPDKIEDKTVVVIGNDAFADNQLTSVTIPNSVTTIGDSAFSGNQLTSVTIPNSVTTIGVTAFNNNKLSDDDAYIYKRNGDGSIDNTYVVSYGGAAKDIIIPNSVTTIGYGAFSYNQLTSVTIPNSATTIGPGAFSSNQLTSVTIPNSVTTIENYAFSGNQLTSVTIGNSVTTIGGHAFDGNQLTSVTIPNSVTTIGGSAFSNNQLTSITIPNSVTTIGEAAFNNNKLSDDDAYIYKRNSDGSIDNTYVVSYGGVEKDIIIPNSVTTIGNYAFMENQLTNVTISNSVTTIGDYAFTENQLTSVTIPNSVTTIGEWVFGDNQLTSVTIPNSVTSIGQFAFYKSSSSNRNLSKIINTTGRSFDWSNIITGSSGTSSITGTYNGVNVTAE